MRVAERREKVLRISVSHGGRIRTSVLSAFRSWHVSTSRNAELATSLIMLRNSDIYARSNRNARNLHFARKIKRDADARINSQWSSVRRTARAISASEL